MHWNKKLLKHINIYIPILVLSLIIIGLFIISSATGMADGNHQPFIRTQIAATVLGIILIIIMMFFDYRILKDYDFIIYFFYYTIKI